MHFSVPRAVLGHGCCPGILNGSAFVLDVFLSNAFVLIAEIQSVRVDYLDLYSSTSVIISDHAMCGSIIIDSLYCLAILVYFAINPLGDNGFKYERAYFMKNE